MEDYNGYNYPREEQPVPSYYNSVGPQPNTLVWGILSLALACFCGFIFGIIGRVKGNKYVRSGGTLTGASKVGYILSLVGIIVGSIATVIFIIYLIALGRATSELSNLYRYYY